MPNIIDIKQNTKSWTEWRGHGLGASDAPVVMGKSPWTTPFQLWAYKTGAMPRPDFNVFQLNAMKRGHDLEPEARRRAEKLFGLKFEPTCFEHEEHPFLRVSLDGYNAEGNVNLEIKCPGKVDHAKAVAGEVPDKYMPQIQMQMAVSGAAVTQYFSWDGKDSEAIVTVLPDLNYINELQDKMIKFWRCIQTNTPPEVGLDELDDVVELVRKDLDKAFRTFQMLSLVCEAITKETRK